VRGFDPAGGKYDDRGIGTTTYTWDPTGLGTVIADGTVENVFGPAGLAEQVTDSSQAPQFASADALGTIRLVTDASGTVVGTGSYGAFGTPNTGTVTLGGFGFTGEQVDPETGFVYLRNRYYDPTTSRFLTPDPLGFLGSGVNLYAYVGNNPATLTDPSGLAIDVGGGYSPGYGNPFDGEGPKVDLGGIISELGNAIAGAKGPIIGGVLGFCAAATGILSSDTGPAFSVTVPPRPGLKFPANQLPTGGERPYVPKKVKGNPDVVRAPGGGYEDVDGNIWTWGKGQHAGPHWGVEHKGGTHKGRSKRSCDRGR
jgi:RHS repeat-associated protein